MNDILRRVYAMDRIEQKEAKKKKEREQIEASYIWNRKHKTEKKWWER